VKEFETTFAKGLKKGLREDEDNPRNMEALVECLNTKPSEEGLIPIVPVTFSVTDVNANMSWPFPQVFDRPIADPICDRTTAVAYGDDDPIIIAINTTEKVDITYGLPPFTWAVVGTGLSWDLAETQVRVNKLTASGSATGTGTWTVTDACSNEAGGATQACPASLAYSGDDPIVQEAGTSVEVTILLGLSPFTWAVTGTDLSWANATTVGRTNTLIFGSSATGSGSWTVTDGCDSEVGGDTTGYSWVSHFDNSDWQDDGVHIAWNGTAWQVDKGGSAGNCKLLAIGTWADDYRPSKVRITYTAVFTLYYLRLEDTDGDKSILDFHNDGIDSLEELDLDFSAGLDISRIHFDPQSTHPNSLIVTDIEFYE